MFNRLVRLSKISLNKRLIYKLTLSLFTYNFAVSITLFIPRIKLRRFIIIYNRVSLIIHRSNPLRIPYINILVILTILTCLGTFCNLSHLPHKHQNIFFSLLFSLLLFNNLKKKI